MFLRLLGYSKEDNMSLSWIYGSPLLIDAILQINYKSPKFLNFLSPTKFTSVLLCSLIMSGFERCSSSPLLIGAILLFNLAVADGNAVDNTDDDVKIMKVFFGWISPGAVTSNVRNLVLVIIGILALIACLCFLVYCFVCGGNDNKKVDAKSNEKSSKKSGTDLESGLVSDADSKTAEKSDIKSEADKSDKKDDKKEDNNKKSDKKDDKKSEKEHTAKSKSSSSSSSEGKKKKSKKGKKGKDDKKKDKKGGSGKDKDEKDGKDGTASDIYSTEESKETSEED
ncbi:unnamed protein product [Meloidogyne enterolobii]|uniref:Uncharacterized protein n=1 Tax=Meloidogyne enterolobii TaxID=390850 RepID=A0ACB0ZEC3_MELEN